AYLADRILVMGTNPGRIAEVIENPVPRPRSDAQFLSAEFLALKKRLEEHIHPPLEVPDKLPMIKLTEAGDEVE
ncbi:MAG: NitT/TauT family transport system ATP-binding protein, partial [Verrucomicrobiota bacterium]